MPLIIYGPQGCGKTRNAQRLAAHFGLKNILDGWDGGPIPADTLVLTNQPGVVGAIDFGRAMAELSAEV